MPSKLTGTALAAVQGTDGADYRAKTSRFLQSLPSGGFRPVPVDDIRSSTALSEPDAMTASPILKSRLDNAQSPLKPQVSKSHEAADDASKRKQVLSNRLDRRRAKAAIVKDMSRVDAPGKADGIKLKRSIRERSPISSTKSASEPADEEIVQPRKKKNSTEHIINTMKHGQGHFAKPANVAKGTTRLTLKPTKPGLYGNGAASAKVKTGKSKKPILPDLVFSEAEFLTKTRAPPSAIGTSSREPARRRHKSNPEPNTQTAIPLSPVRSDHGSQRSQKSPALSASAPPKRPQSSASISTASAHSAYSLAMRKQAAQKAPSTVSVVMTVPDRWNNLVPRKSRLVQQKPGSPVACEGQSKYFHITREEEMPYSPPLSEDAHIRQHVITREHRPGIFQAQIVSKSDISNVDHPPTPAQEEEFSDMVSPKRFQQVFDDLSQAEQQHAPVGPALLNRSLSQSDIWTDQNTQEEDPSLTLANRRRFLSTQPAQRNLEVKVTRSNVVSFTVPQDPHQSPSKGHFIYSPPHSFHGRTPSPDELDHPPPRPSWGDLDEDDSYERTPETTDLHFDDQNYNAFDLESVVEDRASRPLSIIYEDDNEISDPDLSGQTDPLDLLLSHRRIPPAKLDSSTPFAAISALFEGSLKQQEVEPEETEEDKQRRALQNFWKKV